MKAKRVLSIVLALVMICSVFSTAAYASDGEKTLSFEIEGVSKDMLVKKYAAGGYESAAKYALGTGYKLYDSIPNDAKAIYRQLESDNAGLTSSPRGTIKINMSSYGKNLSKSAITTAVCYACAALSDDKPEYQWLLNAPFKVEYSGAGGRLELKTDMSQLPYKNWKEIEKEYNNLLNAVNSFTISGNNRYERVKSIHDKLAQRASYSKNLNSTVSAVNSKIFYPSSALLSPYETVCDGYAKAFKMICDRYGIPCIVVTGYGYSPDIFGLLIIKEGHTWNYVKMEDGKWYAVDLTWDDIPGSLPSYDYFLAGSQTRDSDGYAFSRTHDPVGDRFKNTYLKYPQMSSSKYVYDPSVYLNMPGDVNGDGEVTIVDAKWVLQSIVKIRTFNSDQASKADVNGDLEITISDAKGILALVVGINSR